MISVISAVYKAEKIIDELVKRNIEILNTLDTNFEIILVEDGSPDKSWEKILENCTKDNRVKGIKLSRNFGQHYAITAGLEASKGDYVVVMDCDLQDNPVYIPELYKKAKDGFDIVYTIKQERAHSFIKNMWAYMYFRVFNYLSNNTASQPDMGGYSLLTRKAVNAFCRVKEMHRHYLLVLGLLGFSSASVEIVHQKRYEGKSSYNFSRLLKHAINGITSQSDKLLLLSVFLGFTIFLLSVSWATFLLVQYFRIGAKPGYTSMMVMLLFATGIILISIGILGIYIGKIFEQVKERPLYFIDTKINFN